METRKKRKPEILLRKVLSYVMTVVLIAGMIPMTVKADPEVWTDWNLWIGDSTSFTTSLEQSTVQIVVPGATSGTATFTASGTKSGTLVLNNFHYEGIGHTDPNNPGSFSNCPISAGLFWAQPDGILTIELIGENVITQTGKGTEDSAEMVCGIFAGNNNASIKITGEGSLTVTSGNDEERESYGIKLWGTSLTIEGGTITATGGETNKVSAGYDGWGLTQTGGVFNANGGNGSYSYGVNSVNNPVEITGGKLNATGKTGVRSMGIESYQGVKLSGDAECTATGGDAEQFSLGIDSSYVTVEGTASLKCSAGKVVTGRSIGIDANGDQGLSIGADIKSVISSGDDCAVTKGYYPSNSNYNPGKVTNAIRGLGWSNVDGTEDETEIAVSAEGQELDFKKVEFPLLGTINATAAGFNGKYDGQPHGIAVSVTKPESGSKVRYGLSEGTYDKESSPTFTDPGTYSVYYSVSANGFKTLNGKADVVIKHNLKKHDRVEPTETTEGSIEYWECTDENCKKLFADENGTTEITKEQTVLPIKVHSHTLKKHDRVEPTANSEGNIEYWECTGETCKKLFSDAAGTKEITLADTVLPKLLETKTEDKKEETTEINGVPVKVEAEVTYPKAVTWTGSKITKAQLGVLSKDGKIVSVSMSGLEKAVEGMKPGTDVNKLVTVSCVINKEKNVGKTSSFKVKLKLNNTAVKKAKIKGADKKALNELVKKLNDDLSQKEYTFEIAPINLAEAESVTISAKLKDNKLQVNDDGTLKGLKSIKVKYKARGAAKAKTYSYNAKKAAKQFSIIVTNAEEKNVTVNANTDGNFTGSLPVKIGK